MHEAPALGRARPPAERRVARGGRRQRHQRRRHDRHERRGAVRGTRAGRPQRRPCALHRFSGAGLPRLRHSAHCRPVPGHRWSTRQAVLGADSGPHRPAGVPRLTATAQPTRPQPAARHSGHRDRLRAGSLLRQDAPVHRRECLELARPLASAFAISMPWSTLNADLQLQARIALGRSVDESLMVARARCVAGRSMIELGAALSRSRHGRARSETTALRGPPLDGRGRRSRPTRSLRTVRTPKSLASVRMQIAGHLTCRQSGSNRRHLPAGRSPAVIQRCVGVWPTFACT